MLRDLDEAYLPDLQKFPFHFRHVIEIANGDIYVGLSYNWYFPHVISLSKNTHTHYMYTHVYVPLYIYIYAYIEHIFM